MTSGRRVVPWRDAGEWQVTYASLFSADIASQDQAYRMLQLWHARTKLPVAIDNSLNLLNPLLGDALGRSECNVSCSPL